MDISLDLFINACTTCISVEITLSMLGLHVYQLRLLCQYLYYMYISLDLFINACTTCISVEITLSMLGLHVYQYIDGRERKGSAHEP